MHLSRGWNFAVPDHPIGHTCRIGTSKFFFGTKKFSHSVNLQATIWMAGFVRVLPKSSFKKLLLGTGLAARQNEYLPKISWWVEGRGVQERAAVPLAAHSARTCGWHCHAQGRNATFHGQASRRVTPQYAHLLPWEQKRNTLHTLLRSSVSSNRRGCPRSVGC